MSIGITGESGWNPSPGEDRPSGSPSPSEESSTGLRRQVLIVEDNAADVYLIREAFALSQIRADLHVVDDGEKAVQFFDRVDRTEGAPCPALVILDINLPKKPGGEVLRHMRNSRKCSKALVVVVSTSDATLDRDEMARLGANGYFHKPSDYDGFMKLGEVIRRLLG